MPADTENTKSLAGSTVKGVVLLSSVRWIIRLIGIVSISISARVLTPEDFGIHSSAALIFGFVLIFQSVGLYEFLAKEKEIDANIINTSWTIQLCVAAAISCLGFLALPLLEILVNEPRARISLALLALIPLIDSLQNPQMMLLIRELDYGTLFKLRLTERILGFVCMIGLVLYFQTFWAIALGALTQSVLFTAYTYFYWPQRPVLTLSKYKSVTGFAIASFGRAITDYIARNADSYAVRQFTGPGEFALYHNGKDLVRNLVFEVAGQVGVAMMPTIARIRDDRDRLQAAMENALGVSCLFTGLLSLGLYFTAQEVIGILLGEQWLETAPLVAIIALAQGMAALGNIFRGTLVGFGRINSVFYNSALRMVFVVSASIALYFSSQTIIYFGYMLLIAHLLAFCQLLFILRREISILGLLSAMARPALVVASSFVLASISLSFIEGSTNHPFAGFLLKGSVFTVIYMSSAVFIWAVSGRPNGPETALWQQVSGVLKRK